jgi:hypothetical protein
LYIFCPPFYNSFEIYSLTHFLSSKSINMFSKSITYASIASVATAHIVMTNPPIFPLMGGVMNAPLMGASGAPFPCGTTDFSGVQASSWEAGSTQTLTFKGVATHGGGSCQISVSTDLNPTPNSVWKVIKSIEGGCPVKNQPGNLPGDDANAPLPEGYDVEIPDLPAGAYTLAWTWFNKVGNREMYMNCAPVQITGGSGTVDPNSLPNMLAANINNGCATTEGVDIQFPDAGSNVVQFGTGTYGPPVGSCGSTGGGDSIVNPVTPAPPSDPVVPPSDPAVPPSDPVVPPSVNPVTPPSPPPAPVVPSQGPSGACTEGNWNCIDGQTYSRCAGGQWSAVMPVAAGTSCTVGESATLNVV